MIYNEAPLVSIVAPMYNVDKYIKQFVQCILEQTYTNWELILVDDGSTDKTINLVQNFSDSRIRVMRREHRPKGANACRNIGMNSARGKYIIIFDSDDLVEKVCLEQRVHFMECNHDVDYATARGLTIAEKTDGTVERTCKVWGEPTDDDILTRLISTDYPFGVWNNIYRAESVRDCQWDEQLQIYQDFDFMVTVALKEKRHAYIEDSKIDYFYREGRPNAITANYISESKYESTLYLFQKIQSSIEDLLNQKELHNAFKKFYILQYERLLTRGSINQYKHYYSVFLEEYSNKRNIRIRLMNKVFGNNCSEGKLKNSEKTIFVTHLLLFDQRRLLKVIHKKIHA